MAQHVDSKELLRTRTLEADSMGSQPSLTSYYVPFGTSELISLCISCYKD